MTEPLDDARGELSPLDFYIRDWQQLLWDETGDQRKVERVLELARLNGMFDPIRISRAAPARCDAESVEAVAKRFIESALQWQPVFEDGRGGNDLPFAETRDLLCKRLAAALVPLPQRRGGCGSRWRKFEGNM